MNFDLWHQEDIARRDDLGPERVRQAKRAIDRCNQSRNFMFINCRARRRLRARVILKMDFRTGRHTLSRTRVQLICPH
jgi:hypothetical protein